MARPAVKAAWPVALTGARGSIRDDGRSLAVEMMNLGRRRSSCRVASGGRVSKTKWGYLSNDFQRLRSGIWNYSGSRIWYVTQDEIRAERVSRWRFTVRNCESSYNVRKYCYERRGLE